MNRKKRFVSLNIKMTAAILLGIVLAFCMYLCCTWFESYITDNYYASQAVVDENVNEAYANLEKYIKDDHIEATDREALAKWVQEQKYTYLFVYDNYTNMFEAGWGGDMDVDQQDSSPLYAEGDEDRIDKSTYDIDIKNRIVKFKDGEYYTFIDVYKEQHWHEIMTLVTVALCFLTLLTTLLIYNKRTLNWIITLSSEVQQISDGKLDYEIHAFHRDEIGALSTSVDNMRNSIIQKHENEKMAWEANTQLITAMSHDIRTPLTSLIGYLDIIEGKKYKSQEELDKYVSSCRDKAFQLKELSDKLFQYFLVFGNQGGDRTLESYDASILFQQLLAEHCAEAINYGYRFDFRYNIPEASVMTDISGLRRLFDNVFSNIMKYADKKEPIVVKAGVKDSMIQIVIQNYILEEAKKVESTRIGLRTCEKICSDLQGNFCYSEEDHVFRAEIIFPAAEADPEPDAEHNEEETKGEREMD